MASESMRTVAPKRSRCWPSVKVIVSAGALPGLPPTITGSREHSILYGAPKAPISRSSSAARPQRTASRCTSAGSAARLTQPAACLAASHSARSSSMAPTPSASPSRARRSIRGAPRRRSESLAPAASAVLSETPAPKESSSSELVSVSGRQPMHFHSSAVSCARARALERDSAAHAAAEAAAASGAAASTSSSEARRASSFAPSASRKGPSSTTVTRRTGRLSSRASQRHAARIPVRSPSSGRLMGSGLLETARLLPQVTQVSCGPRSKQPQPRSKSM
mmetsp:Transcript_30844/g.70768  ORF Transcript_30844/g.70768 Transcript_30844/m.70768 type:complete len:279 (-) Transcript_30844:350-1186(-)